MMTPFHAYHLARTLENLPDEEKLIPVYASSDIRVYPFQVAAAQFALRSPWRKGSVLCDEAGMGKSHEALLILAQRYLEGCDHILICIPNADLLEQWRALLDETYTLPYTIVLSKREDGENLFDRSGLVLTTYMILTNSSHMPYSTKHVSKRMKGKNRRHYSARKV